MAGAEDVSYLLLENDIASSTLWKVRHEAFQNKLHDSQTISKALTTTAQRHQQYRQTNFPTNTSNLKRWSGMLRAPNVFEPMRLELPTKSFRVDIPGWVNPIKGTYFCQMPYAMRKINI